MSEEDEGRRDGQPPSQPPPPPVFVPPPAPQYQPPAPQYQPPSPQYQPPPPPPGYAPPGPSYPPPGYSPPASGYPPPPNQPPPPGYPPAPGQEPASPFDYPQQPQAPGRPARRQGFLGGLVSALLAIWAFIKYGGLLLLKFGAFKTLLTLGISLGLWALFIGPLAAVALVAMILIHELGHYAEIKRQGGTGAGIVFVPFFGAATYQRSLPADALKQAEIAIAGPIAGTVAATVAFVVYGLTHSPVILYAAYIGFLLNLINLIPAGFLDGGRILGAVSKWFQVVGVAGILLAVFVIGISPILLIIGLLGIPTLIERFRNDNSAYYQSVPVAARWAIGISWLVLVSFLGFATAQSSDLLRSIIRT